LIEADDDLDSISAAAGAIVKYVSQRAGIGGFVIIGESVGFM
jgi:ribonucleoside-diphosphate reductase alpha chain